MNRIEKSIEKILPKPKIIECHYVMTPEGAVKLDKPIMSNDHLCKWCGKREHVTCLKDPGVSNEYCVMCVNTFCDTFTKRSRSRPTLPTLPAPRAIEWASFCEINHIGDLHHNVTFEGIEQSAAKIKCLTKFIETPKSLILMQGTPGSGKTYAAMGLCEKLTRTSRSVLFTTQRQLADSWLSAFKEERHSYYADGLMRCRLLVIDDFGAAEMSKSLLEFFMQIIDTRLQWSNRGTVITTNLSEDKMAEFCGDALADRLNTGQQLLFTGKSRRKETIL